VTLNAPPKINCAAPARSTHGLGSRRDSFHHFTVSLTPNRLLFISFHFISHDHTSSSEMKLHEMK